MASNTFGNIFRITTWGESHGKAIGVVIDGCPAGVHLDNADLEVELKRRAPGNSAYTSPRKETDQVEIYSGCFQGKTTGAPISIIIPNRDVDSSSYEVNKDLLKPGHANYTYLQKYGIYDYRGGGRASARETACRVAAGAVAKKFLRHHGIEVIAFIQSLYVHSICPIEKLSFSQIQQQTIASKIFCPDKVAEAKMFETLSAAIATGDSLGGTVGFIAEGVSAGLGDPIYEKLEANLAKAMLSIPASKGFEIGSGFAASTMQGSEHNDLFISSGERIQTSTNHAGGTLAGISTGMPLFGSVAFKPTSSIKRKQQTVNVQGDKAIFDLPNHARHDPCVAIRAVPVVEAMAALVLADALLMARCNQV